MLILVINVLLVAGGRARRVFLRVQCRYLLQTKRPLHKHLIRRVEWRVFERQGDGWADGWPDARYIAFSGVPQ